MRQERKMRKEDGEDILYNAMLKYNHEKYHTPFSLHLTMELFDEMFFYECNVGM